LSIFDLANEGQQHARRETYAEGNKKPRLPAGLSSFQFRVSAFLLSAAVLATLLAALLAALLLLTGLLLSTALLATLLLATLLLLARLLVRILILIHSTILSNIG
jgi:hypothetical protein